MSKKFGTGMYEFKVVLGGHGSSPEEAWEDAINNLTMEPGEAPTGRDVKFLGE